jgi:pyruvate/oxaloacetate carboxyltransferase
MKKKLLIRDLTMRDGQQSQFATRMSQRQVERLLPYYKKANFYAVEVWGGAVPDSIMRYLGEDPWFRLESVKAAIGDVSKLTALSRGRNLFGYNPYPDSVIEGFNRNAVKSGIGIMRIFDALNDISNMKSTINYVKLNGGLADCAVCYTVDPKYTFTQKMKRTLAGKKTKIFTQEYFVNLAKQLESFGADIISVKDMAGLIPPEVAGPLIRELKKEVSVPIDIHTHCTPGYGIPTLLVSMINGVDIIDTAIMNFAGGPAAPAFEVMQIFADKLGLDTGIDLEAVAAINVELLDIRKELDKYDTTKMFPKPFDISKDKLPEEVDNLFNKAIEFAKAEKYNDLIDVCNEIDKYFNFPGPDEIVKEAEIPGGMYTNMLAQLKQGKLDHLLNDVMKIVPEVRLAAGLPPLVTPTSQIVGAQAVNCIVDQTKGQPFYTTKSVQFVNLVKGVYGKTPIEVDPDFREAMCGTREETPYDTSKYQKQQNPSLPEFEGTKLALNEKEELLLELFPAVAGNFLKTKRETEYRMILEERERRRQEELAKIPPEPELTPEEKEAILQEGLYNGW